MSLLDVTAVVTCQNNITCSMSTWRALTSPDAEINFVVMTMSGGVIMMGVRFAALQECSPDIAGS